LIVEFLFVFLGAGVGGALRHAVNIAVVRVAGFHFPLGTMTVNILGSLVMGLLIGWFAERSDPGQAWRLFLTTGMLGGFTTFSTFSLDFVATYERGQIGMALTYLLLSVGLGILALFAGLSVMRAVS
jgi:CrcB protein